MEHSLIVLNFLFPTNEQPTEAVQPRVRAFDHPAPRSVARDLVLLLRFFTTGGVAPGFDQVSNLRIVVTFIQTQVLGLAPP